MSLKKWRFEIFGTSNMSRLKQSLNRLIKTGVFRHCILETDSKKIILDQKYSPNKKSTVVVQSSSNLVKMISSWVERIAKISAKLE